jgi:hypothetical protein
MHGAVRSDAGNTEAGALFHWHAFGQQRQKEVKLYFQPAVFGADADESEWLL